MFVSVAAVLGATLGTVSGALTLCGLSLLCKNCKKSKFERDDSTDSERAKASILHTLTQVRSINIQDLRTCLYKQKYGNIHSTHECAELGLLAR